MTVSSPSMTSASPPPPVLEAPRSASPPLASTGPGGAASTPFRKPGLSTGTNLLDVSRNNNLGQCVCQRWEGGVVVLRLQLPVMSLVHCVKVSLLRPGEESRLDFVELSRDGEKFFPAVVRAAPSDSRVTTRTDIESAATGVASVVRLGIAGVVERAEDMESSDGEGHSESEDETTGASVFRRAVQKVTIEGFAMNRSPASAKVIVLLNLTSALQHSALHEDAVEADFLCGLATMNSRRFVQAAEMFRRAEDRLLQSLEARGEGASKEEREGVYRRCSQFELMAAEVMTQHGHLYDRLNAYHKATMYFNGGSSEGLAPLNVFADMKTSLLGMQPHLTNLLLLNLSAELEHLQLAASTGLEFVLETIGCSIGPAFAPIVDAILKTFPTMAGRKTISYTNRTSPDEVPAKSNAPSESTNQSTPLRPAPAPSGSGGPGAGIKHRTTPRQNATAALVDSYNRLFETCYSLLPHFNHRYLEQFLRSVLQPHLEREETGVELKMQLLRLLALVISRIKGDIHLSHGLLTQLLTLLTHPVRPLRNAGRRCWTMLRKRMWSVFSVKDLPHLVEWINNMLNGLPEVKDIEASTKIARQSPGAGGGEESLDSFDVLFSFLIEFLTDLSNAVVAINEGAPVTHDYCYAFCAVLPTLLRLLPNKVSEEDSTAHFTRIWRCFEGVYQATPEHLRPNLNAIVLPMLKMGYQLIEMSSPRITTLHILETILRQLCPDAEVVTFLLDFLRAYCVWVPHSTHDETFHVLTLLLDITRDALPRDLVVTIIYALLDRYTVKGKVYRKMEKFFISLIMATGDDQAATADDLTSDREGTEGPADSESCRSPRESGEAEGSTTPRMRTPSRTRPGHAGAGIDGSIPIASASTGDGGSPSSGGSRANRSYVDVVLECCLFENKPPVCAYAKGLDMRQLQVEHDSFVEKLSFLLKCVEEVHEWHMAAVLPRLEAIFKACGALLDHADAKVRSVSFEIVTKLAKAINEAAIRNAIDDDVMPEGACTVPGRLANLLMAFLRAAVAKNYDPELQLVSALFLKQFFDEIVPTAAGACDELPEGSADAFKAADWFGGMLALWDDVLEMVASPWKNLGGVALWILVDWASFPVAGLPLNTGLVAEFQAKLRRSLLVLLRDGDWECRLGGLYVLDSYFGSWTLAQQRRGTGEGGPDGDKMAEAGAQVCGEDTWRLIYSLQDSSDGDFRLLSRALVSKCCPPDLVARIGKERTAAIDAQVNAYMAMLKDKVGENAGVMDYIPGQLAEMKLKELSRGSGQRTFFLASDSSPPRQDYGSRERGGFGMMEPPKSLWDDSEYHDDVESLEEFAEGRLFNMNGPGPAVEGLPDNRSLTFLEQLEEDEMLQEWQDKDNEDIDFDSLGIIDYGEEELSDEEPHTAAMIDEGGAAVAAKAAGDEAARVVYTPGGRGGQSQRRPVSNPAKARAAAAAAHARSGGSAGRYGDDHKAASRRPATANQRYSPPLGSARKDLPDDHGVIAKGVGPRPKTANALPRGAKASQPPDDPDRCDDSDSASSGSSGAPTRHEYRPPSTRVLARPRSPKEGVSKQTRPTSSANLMHMYDSAFDDDDDDSCEVLFTVDDDDSEGSSEGTAPSVVRVPEGEDNPAWSGGHEGGVRTSAASLGQMLADGALAAPLVRAPPASVRYAGGDGLGDQDDDDCVMMDDGDSVSSGGYQAANDDNDGDSDPEPVSSHALQDGAGSAVALEEAAKIDAATGKADLPAVGAAWGASGSSARPASAPHMSTARQVNGAGAGPMKALRGVTAGSRMVQRPSSPAESSPINITSRSAGGNPPSMSSPPPKRFLSQPGGVVPSSSPVPLFAKEKNVTPSSASTGFALPKTNSLTPRSDERTPVRHNGGALVSPGAEGSRGDGGDDEKPLFRASGSAVPRRIDMDDDVMLEDFDD